MMTLKKYALISVIIATLLPLFSCQGHGGGKEDMNTPEQDAAAEEDITLFTVTRGQFEAVRMVLGEPSLVKFEDEVKATGYIRALPSGKAEVSGLIPGRIRKVYHTIGDRVARGDILLSLESNEFIGLQQEYAVASNKEKLLAAEYDRQKTLYEEQVTAQKDFLRVESEYKNMVATREGLRARLRMVNVSPEQVEDGSIIPYLDIRTPIGGFITRQELVLGRYIMPDDVLAEVVDTGMLQLYLQVFEKDLSRMNPGQKVQFFTPDQPGTLFEATLSRTGRSIDPDNKTVSCLATINTREPAGFVDNLFVEARVITREREVLAVPQHAVVLQAGEHSYLLELQRENEQELVFQSREVRVGATWNGYTEILEPGIGQVLIEGAYDLWME